MLNKLNIQNKADTNDQITEMKRSCLNSFSLVELLVFVSILSIFFVMAASVVTVSLRNMKFNEHKLKATHYANQLEEWLRSRKEIDWGGDLCDGCSTPVSFTQYVSRQGNQTTYCFNTNPVTNWGNVAVCPGYTLDSLFKREATFTSTPDAGGYIAQVNASITVSWLELGQLRSVTNNTLFSVLEQ